MRHGTVGVVLLVGLLLASTQAQAATVLVKVCAKYTVDFEDADTGVGDDVLTSTAPVPARGVGIAVLNGSSFVTSGYAQVDGSNVGCLGSVALLVGHSYNIYVYSEASINGNTVTVHDNDTDDRSFAEVWSYTVPSFNVIKTVTTSNNDQWSIMAAASEAAYRQTGGMSGKKWQWYDQRCPVSGSGQASNCLHIANGGWNAYACDRVADGDTGTTNDCDLTEQAPALHKYEIGHQMGHLASFFVSGTSQNDGAIGHLCNAAPVPTGSHCGGGSGHEINSMEYQAQAAYEGMADIWAAMAYNDMGPGEGCKFVSCTPVDWDNDDNDDNQTFDCAGANLCTPTETLCINHSVGGADYQGNECTTTAGDAVEVDYLRFWWQTIRDYGLGAEDILAIWNNANSRHWYSGDACLSDTGTTDTGVPPAELERAAVDSGFVTGAEWDTATGTNGTGR